MDQSLLARIRDRAASLGQTPKAGAGEGEIAGVERELRLSLPVLLKDCLRSIGNGGYGPAYGLIGIGDDGSHGDFGDIVETYRQFERDARMGNETWPVGLLPFCEYGCAIFDCVDCFDPGHPVRTIDQGNLKRSIGSLDDFFERWLGGNEHPCCRAIEESVKFINPFTKREEIRTIRRLV